MKTAITLVLGFFCFLSFESCRCDPDDDNAKKENTSSESKMLKTEIIRRMILYPYPIRA